MAVKSWSVHHTEITCDKCGDTVKCVDGVPNPNIAMDTWTEVQIGCKPSPGDPLATRGQEYLLCSGCAGMLEHFLGLGLKRTGVSSYGDMAASANVPPHRAQGGAARVQGQGSIGQFAVPHQIGGLSGFPNSGKTP